MRPHPFHSGIRQGDGPKQPSGSPKRGGRHVVARGGLLRAGCPQSPGDVSVENNSCACFCYMCANSWKSFGLEVSIFAPFAARIGPSGGRGCVGRAIPVRLVAGHPRAAEIRPFRDRFSADFRRTGRRRAHSACYAFILYPHLSTLTRQKVTLTTLTRG